MGGIRAAFHHFQLQPQRQQRLAGFIVQFAADPPALILLGLPRGAGEPLHLLQQQRSLGGFAEVLRRGLHQL
jgi:hypothetical protein